MGRAFREIIEGGHHPAAILFSWTVFETSHSVFCTTLPFSMQKARHGEGPLQDGVVVGHNLAFCAFEIHPRHMDVVRGSSLLYRFEPKMRCCRHFNSNRYE